MEPAMNPALEAQAVGRVYRLGQRKPVQVIKLRMKDSFESRLVKILRRKYDTVSKPAPSESNDEEKKSDNTDDGKKAAAEETSADISKNSPATAAALGHMTKDKADLMTEEFDALFGITEPQVLPGNTSTSTSISSAAAGPTETGSSAPSLPYGLVRRMGRGGCTCGNCSDADSGDEGNEGDCVIS